ncbi:hypothetical protein I4F81_005321 [Pyropia yezoensis]|uniref:Uncharacterized protein n=1 Tax=Pyropia yezoensis TaxID=2788 RepID=A0ACC3BXV5_PYRYE|nr:hypothetical protein I4F81_005321 [Neopyropia yezoensis]
MARCTARRLVTVAAAAVVAVVAAVALPTAVAQEPTSAAAASATSSPPPTSTPPPPPPPPDATPAATAGRDGPLATWSYGGATGPATWHTLNPSFERCDAGDAQSPVNVVTTAAAVDAAGTTVETLVRAAGNTTLTTTRVANSIVFTCTDGCGRLSWDGRTYGLAGVALHAAAEHPVDGVPHAMEVQFGYTAPSGAAVRLAVVLSLAVEPHPLVAKLVDAIEADADGGTLRLTPAEMGTMLVPGSGFCTWSGSLTTPPCTEGIRWFLQTTVLGVTRAQVEAFSAARGGGSNARPVQPGGNATRLPSGASVAVAVAAGEAASDRPSLGTSPVFMWSHRSAGGRYPFVRLTTARHGSLTLSSGHLVYVGGVAVPAGSVAVGDVLAAVAAAPPLEAADAACAGGGPPTATTPAACRAPAAPAGLVAAPVTRVSRVWAAGLYHPHTLTGEPLVDGFHVSAMTTAVGGGRSAAAALGVAARVYGLVGWAWGGLEAAEWGRGAGASVLAALG